MSHFLPPTPYHFWTKSSLFQGLPRLHTPQHTWMVDYCTRKPNLGNRHKAGFGNVHFSGGTPGTDYPWGTADLWLHNGGREITQLMNFSMSLMQRTFQSEQKRKWTRNMCHVGQKENWGNPTSEKMHCVGAFPQRKQRGDRQTDGQAAWKLRQEREHLELTDSQEARTRKKRGTDNLATREILIRYGSNMKGASKEAVLGIETLSQRSSHKKYFLPHQPPHCRV